MRGVGPVPDRWTVGLHERTDPAAIISLWGTILRDAAAKRYSTLREAVTAAPYQVPTGKLLWVIHLAWQADVAGVQFAFGEADTNVGFSSAADGANPVNLDAAANSGAGLHITLAANTIYQHNPIYVCLAGLFPRIMVDAGAAANLYIQAHGVERDA